MASSQKFWLYLYIIGLSAIAIAALFITFFEPLIPFISDIQAMRILLALGIFALLMWIAVKLIIYYYYPPLVRFIRIIAFFLMSLMTSILGGSVFALAKVSNA